MVHPYKTVHDRLSDSVLTADGTLLLVGYTQSSAYQGEEIELALSNAIIANLIIPLFLNEEEIENTAFRADYKTEENERSGLISFDDTLTRVILAGIGLFYGQKVVSRLLKRRIGEGVKKGELTQYYDKMREY